MNDLNLILVEFAKEECDFHCACRLAYLFDVTQTNGDKQEGICVMLTNYKKCWIVLIDKG